MKPIIPILLLVSAAWIFGGAYYLANTSCAGTSAIAPLSISDGELDFNTGANQHFSFIPSSSVIGIEEEASKAFGNVAKHLEAHPDRQLTLNGWFLENEKNDTEYENLGIARAEQVKSFLVNIDSSIINRIFTTGEQKSAITTINEKQIDGVEFNFSGLTSETSSTGVTESDLTESTTGTAVSSTSNVAVPTFALYGKDEIKQLKMDINLQQQIDNMKSVLDLNPGAYFAVTGHSEASRSEGKSYDLGLIWAGKVRRFFRNNGIKSLEIKALSKGDQEPLVDKDDSDAATKNNRVTVELVLPE